MLWANVYGIARGHILRVDGRINMKKGCYDVRKNQLGGDDRFFTITHDFHTITKITIDREENNPKTHFQ